MHKEEQAKAASHRLQLRAKSPLHKTACSCTAQHVAVKKHDRRHSMAVMSGVLAIEGWQNLPGQKLAEPSGEHRVGGGHEPLGF